MEMDDQTDAVGRSRSVGGRGGGGRAAKGDETCNDQVAPSVLIPSQGNID